MTLGAYDNEVPFEKVVDRVAPVRDASRNPLFQVGMQLLSGGTAGGGLELPGVSVETITPRLERSRFDLSCTFTEFDDELRVQVEYATDLFDRWRVEGLVGHVWRVLERVVGDGGVRVSEVSLVSGGEWEELLGVGCGPGLDYRRVPVHVVFGEVAGRFPGGVAAVFGGRELTYGELAERSDVVARWLRSVGVGHQDVVAVALDRGFDVLAVLLGVLKAGAAFTVLDTGNPVNRLEFIVRDTGARVVLTHSDLVGFLPVPDGWRMVCVDTEWSVLESVPVPVVWEEWADGDSLAYVLYTSGSTGRPKGVLIEHRALMLYLASFTAAFGLGPGDRLLQYASLVFDLSEAEIFSALTTGAALVLAPRETLMSPEALSELIRRERCTYVGAPPAMLTLVDAEPYPDLKYVLVGGEAFSGDLVNRWNVDGRRFINGYGPTETTIGCTMYECEPVVWRSSPPIGRPLAHRRLYVVDRFGHPCPVGVPGELLIGGDEGLARGYLNAPELTAEKFVPDPFRATGRVYRSGDLVRWTADRQLEFLGRIDMQVKLRGLRIELEEIEAVLATHPNVAQAVVMLREDTPGDKRLVAYLACTPPAPTVSELRTHLAADLPPYMIPSAWVILDSLPLAVSGKVDRKALPVPDTTTPVNRTVTPPTTPTEQQITDIFTTILTTTNPISTDDNFFDLGGNSLQ
ncbi:amino acid adenylation domain-containing protein, partial [Plantactinospora sp. B24E8]|uniref:non-ribosomal peptide synthetase n=1 Tax=Plantactinospora sp. B24E8 TaxID=3153567 RepID=UPI00325E5676